MPTPPLLVTVVVAHYNQAEFLAECVGSLLQHQSPCLKEVLIVDDHSTDIESRDVVRSFEELEKVTVHRLEKNSGVQAARNFGVFSSSSDLVINIDADDKLEPFIDPSKDLFSWCSEIMEEPKVAFVHFISDMFGDCEGYTISSSPLTEGLVLRKFHVPTSICFRRSDFLSGARYDLNIRKWQDWSFGIELLSTRFANNRENKISFINKPYHKYRIHKSENRISMQEHSELHFVEITVRRHLAFFRKAYGNKSPEEIAKAVYEAKPSKLVDLLYTAHFNLETALKMVNDRQASLFSHIDTLGVP